VQFVFTGEGLTPGVLNSLWGVAALLAASTAWRLVQTGRSSTAESVSTLQSLASWWVCAALFAGSVLLGRAGMTVLVGLISLLGIVEYTSLTGIGSVRRTLQWATPVVVLNCLFLYAQWTLLTYVFVPLVMFLAIGAWVVVTGRIEGFQRIVPTVYWGVVLTVFCPAYAVRLLFLPESWNRTGGVAGWFVFLVLLTEGNDIAQALIGRRFGRRLLAARLSPKKTWEGFIGGLVVCVMLAMLLGGWLTPLTAAFPPHSVLPSWIRLPVVPAVIAGVLIAVAGLFGDLHVSALKRDLGVKDSGTIVPGQGGILDRIDSLTFTAPAFYYYVLVCYSESGLVAW